VKVVFTKRATVQITAALDYVAVNTPQGAASIHDRLGEIRALLGDHPYMGHRTSMPGVRRFAVPDRLSRDHIRRHHHAIPSCGPKAERLKVAPCNGLQSLVPLAQASRCWPDRSAKSSRCQ